MILNNNFKMNENLELRNRIHKMIDITNYNVSYKRKGETLKWIY